MGKPGKTPIFALLLLSALSHLHAQAPAAAPVQSAATAPAQAASGQAPDTATAKITELVHAGKYVDAQKLTEGLLLAYPDDQRLIKAEALIERLLAPTGSTGPTPAASPSAQPAADANAAQLTGMDKVDYDALIVLGRQAQQNTDLDQQKASLRQFMDQSDAFLQKHPEALLLWEIRAQASLSLDEPMAGNEAGQRLLAVGVTDSTDANVRILLAQLKNKGWLDKQGMEDAEQYNWLQSLKLGLAYGIWSTGHFDLTMKTKMTLTVSGLGDMKEQVNILLENASPKACRLDGGATGIITINPGDAAGGIYTTSRIASLIGHNYNVPCAVNASVVDKTGKNISIVTINDGS